MEMGQSRRSWTVSLWYLRVVCVFFFFYCCCWVWNAPRRFSFKSIQKCSPPWERSFASFLHLLTSFLFFSCGHEYWKINTTYAVMKEKQKVPWKYCFGGNLPISVFVKNIVIQSPLCSLYGNIRTRWTETACYCCPSRARRKTGRWLGKSISYVYMLEVISVCVYAEESLCVC